MAGLTATAITVFNASSLRCARVDVSPLGAIEVLNSSSIRVTARSASEVRFLWLCRTGIEHRLGEMTSARVVISIRTIESPEVVSTRYSEIIFARSAGTAAKDISAGGTRGTLVVVDPVRAIVLFDQVNAAKAAASINVLPVWYVQPIWSLLRR